MSTTLLSFVLTSAILLATGVVWLLLSQGRAEARAVLLDLLARATRYGKPFTEIVHRYALERQGRVRRALRRMSDVLERGGGLAESMGAAGPTLFPHPWPERVRAVEGTPALSPYLGLLANEESGRRRATDRLLLVLTYPTVLLIGLITLLPLLRQALFSGVDLSDGPLAVRLSPLVLVAATAICGYVMLRFRGPVARRLAHGPWNITRDRLQLLSLAAYLSKAGLPLHDIADRLEPVALTRWNRRLLSAARTAARRGAGLDTVLAPIAPRGAMRARLLSAPSGRTVATLRDVARRLDARLEKSRNTWLSLLQPATLLAFGVLVLLMYQALASRWFDIVRQTSIAQGAWQW